MTPTYSNTAVDRHEIRFFVRRVTLSVFFSFSFFFFFHGSSSGRIGKN